MLTRRQVTVGVAVIAAGTAWGTRPVSAVVLVMAALLVVWPFPRTLRARRRGALGAPQERQG